MSELPSLSSFITFDLLLRIANLTILNPLFSVWVPFLSLSQRYGTSTLVFKISFYYFLTTLVWVLFSWSDTIYKNQPWKSKKPLAALFGLPILDWEDQIVVVTGGASGVGRVLVETLLMRGVEVVVIDLVKFDEGEAKSYICDLSKNEEIFATCKLIQEEVGHPTILINNAGVVQGKLLLDLTANELKQTFDVNVLAHFSLIKAFLPNMLKNRRGHIVTVASVFALQGVAQLSDYCASKHALIGMHESLLYELKYRYQDPAIRLSILFPSKITTPLFASIAEQSSLMKFLAPELGAHEVVKEIIAALDCDQGRVIEMPVFVKVVWILRRLPRWAGDAVIWLSDGNNAMLPFIKNGKKDN